LSLKYQNVISEINMQYIQNKIFPSMAKIISYVFMFLTITFTGVSLASDYDYMPTKDLNTFSLYLENDYFANTDSNYTSGLKLTWSSAIHADYPKKIYPHKLFYPIIKRLPFGQTPDRKKNITFSLGQSIFTPDNIEKPEIVKDDRPYAGITYIELGFHSIRPREMNTIELYLGLVGPHSYAEQIQKAVHQMFDDIEPKGWDNQLKDEPVIDIIFEYKKKISQSEAKAGFGYDCILNTGGGIGNLMTYYNLGLTLRIGYNMPRDFGNFPIRTVSSYNATFDNDDPRYSKETKIGIQWFISSEGRAVFHNIFLDGNTFRETPHKVDREVIVGDVMTGIGVIVGSAQFTVAYVYRTKEFETQKDAQKFGSINLSISY